LIWQSPDFGHGAISKSIRTLVDGPLTINNKPMPGIGVSTIPDIPHVINVCIAEHEIRLCVMLPATASRWTGLVIDCSHFVVTREERLCPALPGICRCCPWPAADGGRGETLLSVIPYGLESPGRNLGFIGNV
jgi:hypothetical protein